MEQSFFKKIGMITILVVMLALPLEMILSVIRERSFRKDQAYDDIASTWGRAQHLSGPVLSVPYYNGDGELSYGYFLPKTLDVRADLIPETRYRGIFKVIVYRSDLNLSGTFSKPDFAGLGIEESQVLWDQAALTLGINGLGGIQEVSAFQWNDRPVDILPGQGADRSLSGMTGVIRRPAAAGDDTSDTVTGFSRTNRFHIRFNVHGSRQIAFSPSAGATRISVSSPWAHPGFNGSCLPATRTITPQGFDASWQVGSFGREYPGSWLSGHKKSATYLGLVNANPFGVELIQPVNFYTKSERSVKYGLLIICLTFLCFFMFEILNRLRIHPMQYLLVGLGLSIFYLLLVSFAEHIGFLPAYVLSSASCITLITWYTRSFLIKPSATAITGSVLSAFFTLFYVILRHEGYSLVIGSTSLFFVLALVMWLTRRLDWYATFKMPNSLRLTKPCPGQDGTQTGQGEAR